MKTAVQVYVVMILQERHASSLQVPIEEGEEEEDEDEDEDEDDFRVRHSPTIA